MILDKICFQIELILQKILPRSLSGIFTQHVMESSLGVSTVISCLGY